MFPEFTLSPLWLFLLLPLSGIVAWATYRSAQNRIPKFRRYFLIGLRTLTLCLVLILLLEPVLRALDKTVEPPLVVFLQDTSESLMASQDSSQLKEKLPDLFNQFQNILTNADASLASFSFGDGITGNFTTDTLQFQEQSTNIGKALEDISSRYAGQHLAAVVILSDGIITTGEPPVYPASKLSVPIFTLIAGDTVPRKDIALSDLQINEIAYVQSLVPVRVSVKRKGLTTEPIKIELVQGNKVLDARAVEFGAQENEKEFTFQITPIATGVQAYQFRITQLPGEVTWMNNQLRFYLNVLENKQRIHLFAAGPHPDVAAFQRALIPYKQYELITYIRKDATHFYKEPELSDLKQSDLIVLSQFPGSAQDLPWVQKIVEEVTARQVPLLILTGGGNGKLIPPDLQKYMGIVPRSVSGQESEAKTWVAPTYKDHVTFTFDEKWNKWLEYAPPLSRESGDWEAKANTKVALFAQVKSVKLEWPVLGFQEQAGRKNLVFVGENLWKLRMNAFQENNSFTYFDEWIHNWIEWLTVKSDRRRFRVIPSQRLFSGNDKVRLRGEVYDENYKPLSGVEIQVKLKNQSGEIQELMLNENADHQYTAEWIHLPEGEYSYTAEGKRQDKTIGTDRGEFTVGRSAIEYQDLQANSGLMQQLAQVTEGKYYSWQNLPQAAEDIKQLPQLKPLVSYRQTATELHRIFWPLLVIISLLTLEWVIRKWSGLT